VLSRYVIAHVPLQSAAAPIIANTTSDDVTSGRGGAIFLDRDGTLNRKAPEGEYIRYPAELALLPGAASAVRRINAAGIPAILVTNQRWLSGPTADAATYLAVARELARQLAIEGAALDASYVCPHDIGRCGCRKPKPGLLTRAAAELGISLTDSVMIGDAPTDVQAGLAAGLATVLINPTPAPAVAGNSGGVAHFTAADIGQAVDWAIARSTS
jgi:D-glycero-D-manno-heptose 1,7-bisphosphate phosphatase